LAATARLASVLQPSLSKNENDPMDFIEVVRINGTFAVARMSDLMFCGYDLTAN